MSCFPPHTANISPVFRLGLVILQPAFRENAVATNLTDWSQLNSTLFSFHSAGGGWRGGGGVSVNDGIDPDEFTLHYNTLNQVIRVVSKLGVGALMAKFDVEAAYRNVPVHPSHRVLLGMKWRDQFFRCCRRNRLWRLYEGSMVCWLLGALTGAAFYCLQGALPDSSCSSCLGTPLG